MGIDRLVASTEPPAPRFHFSPVIVVAFSLFVVVFVVGMFLQVRSHPPGMGKIDPDGSDLMSVEMALDGFNGDIGRYPTSAEGLGALMKQPTGADKWRGPYLNKAPMDRWGHAYIYTCPGVHNTDRFDLSSFGLDGKAGGGDDITNWSQQ